MKENGGSVFPELIAEKGDYETTLFRFNKSGLTKREYYAGQAITGLLANADYAPLTKEEGEGCAIGFARLSFMVADALIKVGDE
jgi:hypothetical protein